MIDDATCVSALTLDSSFPKDARKRRASTSMDPFINQVEEQRHKCAANIKDANNKIAYVQLAMSIRALQEKIEIAKLLEQVSDNCVFNDTDDDATSYVESNDGTVDSNYAYDVYSGTQSCSSDAGRSFESKTRSVPSSLVSFDADFFQKTNNYPPPMFEREHRYFDEDDRSLRLESLFGDESIGDSTHSCRSNVYSVDDDSIFLSCDDDRSASYWSRRSQQSTDSESSVAQRRQSPLTGILTENVSRKEISFGDTADDTLIVGFPERSGVDSA